MAAAALAIVALALPVTAAKAQVIHKPLFQLGEIPAVGPHGESIAFPGTLGNMESMTVDAGHLWVAEGSFYGSSRVDEFDAKTGAFLGQPIYLPTTPAAESNTPSCLGNYCGTGIAVGHGPGGPMVYIGAEHHGVSVVSVFDETGALKATWTGASTPGGSFGITNEGGNNGPKSGTIRDVAADNSTNPLDLGAGNVYVTASKVPPQGREFEGIHVVDIFHPETGGGERYVGQITGPSTSESFHYIKNIGIEPNGDVLVDDFDQVEQKTTIDIFEPTVTPGGYVFIGKLSGPPPNGVFGTVESLALDAETGDIYTADAGSEGYRIEQFSSAGAYLGHIDDIPDPFAIAVDPSSHYLYARNVVYGPGLVVPDVTTVAVSNLKPEDVTLNGAVNPDGAGGAKCEFEWGTSPALGKVVPCSEAVPDGETQVPVHASLSGLERDQIYYYRLEASNANGNNLGEPWQDQQFATHGVLLREDFVSNVSATSATFGATINPGATPTSFYFQYGASLEYGQQVPAPSGEAIGSSATDLVVPPQQVQGLSASTTYHYRAVAVSEISPGEFETVYGPDHTFTTQPTSVTFTLPDGRQWELVSPANKLGAPIYGLSKEKVLKEGVVQASTSGKAVTYQSGAPTEAEPQGYAITETVLSTRGQESWSSSNISAPHEHAAYITGGTGKEYQIFSEDLAHAVLQPSDSSFTPLSSEASEQTPYLRTDFTGPSASEMCTRSCYRPLVTAAPGYANVPTGTVFGGEPTGVCKVSNSICGPLFQGASPDLSHIVLSSPAQLTSMPAPTGEAGLYEWSAGSLELVGLLPEGEEGPAILAGSNRKALRHVETGVRHAVSDNGERVIMEGGAKGGKGLYLRDLSAGETVKLDVPQGGSGPSEGLSYQTASSDASKVFFLDSGRLTAQSAASGEDLYEYDLNAPMGSRLTDLTADANAGEAADVVQVVGASEDGSYVYFVATGALAQGSVAGRYNLYVSHGGHVGLVAVLANEDSSLYSWGEENFEHQLARVSPNGRWLAFMSSAELTGYDTHDAVSGHPDAEVYLYESTTGSLVCASCNPTGNRPLGSASAVAAEIPGWTGPPINFGSSALRQPRYLSDSGRLFFDSSDALVPEDVDGVEDVYEYEPSEVGDCVPSSTTFVQRSGGCVNLISAGISPAGSEFLDASETGGDVFFTTRARLTAQDYDTAYDVYDAHECTSVVPCFPVTVQPPTCQTESSCRAAPTPQPALYGAPSSATFSGVGNVAANTKSTVKGKAKPSTRARRLAMALKACKKKPESHRRAACERTARARYASGDKVKKRTRRRK